MFLQLLGAFLFGIVAVLVVELLVLYKWFQRQPNEDLKELPSYTPVTNPKDLANFCKLDGATDKESCMFLNLIFQFLWREWRDSPKTRNFFIRKMNMEFQEMLLNKAAGKIMEQITVRDYYLGDSLPEFKSATIMKIDNKNYSQVPQEIDLAVDIDYSGGFVISLDVDLIFGRTASLSIKLNKLVGRVRLQYTRNPCTHWSFSFYEDPIMDLHVDSNFEGKKLPKLTSFIHNQIRKSIKKKHTLPRYKVRYKPFFVKDEPQDGRNEVFIHNNLVTMGKLDLEIVECTRIQKLPKGSHIYCSLSLDILPWKEDMPMKRSMWPVHEVLMSKMKSGSLGVSFGAVKDRNTESDNIELITINTIFPNSPATQVDIQKGDILISVNDVDITNMKQVKRLIKNTGDQFTFKLQRPPASELIDTMNHETTTNGNSMSGSTESQQPKGSNDRIDGGDGSMKNGMMGGNGRDSQSQQDDEFNYDSFILQDDDSDQEEFVNIVCNEFAQDISNDQAEILRQEVQTIQRASLVPLSDDSSLDVVDRSTPIPAINIQNTEPSRRDILNNEKKNTDSPLPSKRSFSFFKRRRTESASTLNRRRTSDTSLLNHPRQDANRFESSLNFEPNTTPQHNKKKEVRISEPAQMNGDDNEETTHRTTRRKMSDNMTKEWDNISQHNIEIFRPDTSALEEEKEPTGQRTSHQNANKELVWNEIFSFDIEKEHRFLNICVWCKHEESFEKDVLIGYVSIPLMELAVECLSTSARKSIRKFHLTAASSRSTISRTYLRTVMPGMNLSCCHGDITIAYRHFISTPESQLPEEDRVDSASLSSKKKVEQSTADEEIDIQKEQERIHNFIGQEFYSPTRCDYCQNKIWRKVAFQCLVCGMISHKRCLQNVQANTYCTSKGVRAKLPKWQLEKTASNESTSTSKPIDQSPEDSPDPSNRLSTQLTVPDETDLRPGIKNNGSASPNVLRRRHKTSQEKPPSLSNHKRTVSLQDMIQEDNSCQNIPEDVDEGDLNDSIATAAVTAKEAGRELYASLDVDSREENIQSKVQRLQREITQEKEQQMQLRYSFERVEEIEAKQKFTLLIRKSEERSQALALLMIQYCAALNECLSNGEPKQVDL
ncbi:PDZ domain-containing protein 8-like [Clytia hemisphaerica]|uniref:PDZ domain-containing protein 8 n=1 Tax=Clytia hemisphaerica TaxID=252671 RepID=A0A7M5VDH7_9CNID